MCVMWMPANLLTSGIVDKKDKICLKKENKETHLDTEITKITTESKTILEQAEKK